MGAWAFDEIQGTGPVGGSGTPGRVAAQARPAGPADRAPELQLPSGVLRHVRRGLSHWLEGVLEANAMARPAALPAQVPQGLDQALQAAGHDSSLQPALADALQQAHALQRMSAGAIPARTLVREGLGLLMRVADLESDWAAQQAWLDPLTGLPGRRALLQRLQAELSRLRRQGDHCCVVLLDLDQFKPVNDEFGHLVGDRYLAAFAGALSARLRSYDAAFRYGGDEFVLCLPQASEQEARGVIERLRLGIAEKPLVQAGGRDLFAAFSAGVAALDAHKSLGQTLGEADSRLYAAKRAGACRPVAV
ncbi:GGDEF domain-containing protein [Thiomonas sp. FB-6]|uniref:GGDEF domain-containing protein n=1 Tax=Thiomonas sp. FB-6 TaxID=1158291 RepID=UPI00036DE4FB|nr:GGDEF domain-containing protein [Thiomonas sp. FB-6]